MMRERVQPFLSAGVSPSAGTARSETESRGLASEAEAPAGGVYIISVAARLLNMHPQTLRKYERLGLVVPSRTVGRLRLYSQQDLLRVRLIRHLEGNLRLNLAGVELVLALVNRLMDTHSRILELHVPQDLKSTFVEEVQQILDLMHSFLPRGI